LTTRPVYQSTTVVMIKEKGSDPSSFVFDFGMNSSKQRLQNEIEILNSYYLHDQVVQSLINDGTANELALFGTKYVRNRYRVISYFFDWIGQSNDTLIQPEDLDFYQRIEVVDELKKSCRTSTVRDADVLKIAVSSTDSSDAILLANRISDTYRNLDLAGGQGELHFILTFLDSQITKYETRLADVEEELKTFQTDSKIYALDGSAVFLLQDLTSYEGIYYTNVAELEAQKVQQMVDEGWNDQSLQARDFNRRITERKDKLNNITESLILSGWSEEDPFAASQEIFNKIVEQEVEVHASRSRASEYKALVDQMSARLTTLPSQTLHHARLERDLRLNENLYLTMKA